MRSDFHRITSVCFVCIAVGSCANEDAPEGMYAQADVVRIDCQQSILTRVAELLNLPPPALPVVRFEEAPAPKPYGPPRWIERAITAWQLSFVDDDSARAFAAAIAPLSFLTRQSGTSVTVIASANPLRDPPTLLQLDAD